MSQTLSQVLAEYTELRIRQQLDYEKFYLYSIITHSTAIEGSTVTEIENQLLFDEGITPNKPLAEQLMNLDLKAAYEKGFSLAASHTEITVDLLCSLSAIVMKNTGSEYNTIAGRFSSAKGELRLLNVSAGRGGKSYLAWQKVQSHLEDFCKWLNESRKSVDKNNAEELYKFSFLTHYKLVEIHPWADGNGRMSRLLMNMIQHEFVLVPSIVKKESRAEYIKSLAESQDADDASSFLNFMISHHKANLEEQIKQYKKSLSDTEKGGQKNKGGQKKWSETAVKLYELIKNNPSATRKELSEELNINPSAVQKHIEKLKERGIIEREGSDKKGFWKIIGEL